MKSSISLLAVIPARAGSKGIKNKNTHLLFDKPLIQWTIEGALASEYVDYVLVSTDSPAIAELSSKLGAQTPFIRPAELAEDESTSIDVILHALENLPAELLHNFTHVALLEPTSPLRKPEDIDKAFSQLLNTPEARSIVGVSKVEAQHPDFLFTNNGSGFLESIGSIVTHKRRQDLVALFYPEGTIYISEIDFLKKTKTFYHSKTIGFELPRWKSYEIDDPEDLIIVEALIRKVALGEL